MGTAYVKRADGTDIALDSVTNIGVAGSFVIFQYEDGSTVLEKESGVQSVQFTPDAPSASEENDGPSANNATA